MSSKAKKQKHILLRKIMAGLILTCFLVFVFGQISQGASAKSLLIWSSLLMFVLFILSQILIKFWSSWEDINDRPEVKKTK
jgi:hypothetical protein